MSYDRLVSVRLAPPAYRIDLLTRSHLLERMPMTNEAQLTIVTAPAGYGKTSLLAQWRRIRLEGGHRVAWLNVANPDTDPAQLVSDIIMALGQGGAALGHLASQAEQGFGDAPVKALVAAVVRALLLETQPITLIIDDSHRLPLDTVNDVLAPIVAAYPNTLHLILSGRERPPISVAALRSRGQVIEIVAQELRFTSDEARQLLPSLAQSNLDTVLETTEGWPVALQLCKLWLDKKPERAALIPKFSGRVIEVADYLTEQVLADLPAESLQILQDVSILESFNSDLIEVLSGRSEAWLKLVRTRKLESFLMPLDEERYWFRLHHLLSDFLFDRLREAHPERLAQLHTTASGWFEAHGMLREAVQHSTAAGDHARTAALIDRAGSWEMVIHGGYGLMRSMLRSMPKERMRDFPRVYFAQLLQLAKEGLVQEALESYEAYRRHTGNFSRLHGPEPKPVQRDAAMVGHLLRCYADRHLPPDALIQIYRECEALDPEDGVGRSSLLNTACLLGLGLGDMQNARVAAQRAVESLRRIGSVLGVNYCYLHLGLSQLHLGSRREAEAIFREALAMAEENFGADSGLKSMSDAYLGIALHARGDAAGAQQHIDRSLDSIESGDGWFDAYAEVYETCTALAFRAGGLAPAVTVTERGLMTANRRGLVRLEALMHASHARIAAIAGDLNQAVIALERVRPAFDPARWTHDPYWWRVDFAAGVAAALISLARGDTPAADSVLAALHAACLAQHRIRHLAIVRALHAAVQFGTTKLDAAARTLSGVVEDRVIEDDLQILIDLGAVLAPTAHYARKWSLENGISVQARRALGVLADRAGEIGPGGADTQLLSPREREVLLELSRGAPNKTIARALQMTENTVKFHLKNVFQKLGVQHRAAAIRVGRERGLLS